jgi:hypothetical protein
MSTVLMFLREVTLQLFRSLEGKNALAHSLHSVMLGAYLVWFWVHCFLTAVQHTSSCGGSGGGTGTQSLLRNTALQFPLVASVGSIVFELTHSVIGQWRVVVGNFAFRHAVHAVVPFLKSGWGQSLLALSAQIVPFGATRGGASSSQLSFHVPCLKVSILPPTSTHPVVAFGGTTMVAVLWLT